MKETLFLVSVCILIISTVMNVSFKQDIERKVRASEPFEFESKEWLCSYTTRQVDINILEEKIVELKK